jgi:hypothetical protein
VAYRGIKNLWTDEEIAALRELYPSMQTVQVAAKLCRRVSQINNMAYKLKIRKTDEYLNSPASGRLNGKDTRGLKARFKKGAVPHNKGIPHRPGWGPGRMKESWFKKGQKSGFIAGREHPVGTILMEEDGYYRIKVREYLPGEYKIRRARSGEVWPLLHRHIWRMAHGEIPQGFYVRFMDGNRKNCVLANLELISRTANMERNTVQRYPEDVKDAIRAIAVLNRKINSKDKHNGEQQAV